MQIPRDASLRLGRRYVEALGETGGVEVEVAGESVLIATMWNSNIWVAHPGKRRAKSCFHRTRC